METDNESKALEQTLNIVMDSNFKLKSCIKMISKEVLGEEGITAVKNLKSLK